MSIEKIRESGILESYVIGEISEESKSMVENALLTYPDLNKDIREIEICFQKYAEAHSIEPHPTEKPMLMTVLAYQRRMESGESPTDPPSLHAGSKVSDYKEWLDNPTLQAPDTYDKMFGHIIGASEEKTMLIVWLTEGAPPETHTDELETFLIVEGTCDIVIGETTHSLTPGDILDIPLHVSHSVIVTSDIACKVILQRKAA